MYDAVIVGGGLAGLVNSLELAKQGFEVLLIEKQAYPFHRVCGEYISNETLPYLQSLGLTPWAHGAVAISRLCVTAPNGQMLQALLPLGGFGLSRYTLDAALCQMALDAGAKVLTKTTVQKVERQPSGLVRIEGAQGQAWWGKVAIAAHGKRSNLDQGRDFFKKRSPYLGVKYHVRVPHPADLIALHNFEGGYCGISQVEGDRCCLCYLAERRLLKQHGSIAAMEKAVLWQNPHLRRIYAEAEFLFDQPKVINEISFAPKPPVEQGILMCGDSAGMIAPLCGNGMAMAIHSAKLLSGLVAGHLRGELDAAQMEARYRAQWRRLFGTRLWVGRQVQRFFGNSTLTNGLLASVKAMPWALRPLIGLTHGRVF